MSFTYGFYNALNHDRLYDAVQVSEIFDGIIRDGVYSTIGDHFVVKPSENDNMVVVGSGRAWFDHTWNKNDADLPIAAPLPDLLLYRYDALVIDVNSNVASRTNDIIWVQGVASLTDPQKPTLINTTERHQYPLCYIYRRPNVNLIDAADIENTIGTDACPFVTGILQQISITDLLSQWTAQWLNFMSTYNNAASQWMDDWTTDFTDWTDDQKDAFASWMADEKITFDDWFANLHYILDGDVAGHLQNEIDDLNDRATGSIFNIHTINSELHGMTVTLTGSSESKSATFDSNGNAVIKGITDVGTIIFESTDGSQTARAQMNVPYFGNYDVEIAFWAATVNISTTVPELFSQTITIKKDGTAIGTTNFSASGTATYTAIEAGVYEFTVTIEETTYTSGLINVTSETTYNAVISGSSDFDYRSWLTAGGIDPSGYSSLDDVLADEEAIRRLMTVHDSVDYLAALE